MGPQLEACYGRDSTRCYKSRELLLGDGFDDHHLEVT